MHRIHKNINHQNPIVHISEDQVLNSFYQQRQKRMNSVSRHHSLLQKNSSYFSSSYNKHINQSNNYGHTAQLTSLATGSDNVGVISTSNIDKKIENIKLKIMRDINNQMGGSIGKKYSLDEGPLRSKDGQKLKEKHIRIQSESSTPKNINMNKRQNMNINNEIQNVNNIIFNGLKKQNRRQKHLDQLQKSFMDLTSPKNCIKQNNNGNNKLIMKKLQKYVNQNKDFSKQNQVKISEMKQNIYIVNRMRDYDQSINSQTTQEDRNKNTRQKYINKQDYPRYIQNSQNESQQQQQINIQKNNKKCIRLQTNDYKIQQQFQSPSFKMSNQLQFNQNVQKIIRQENNKIIQYNNNNKLQQKIKKYENIMNQDQLDNAYIDQKLSQNINKKQFYYDKLIQENQELKKKVQQLQKIRKKQSKFIQSVYRMRRTILKTNQDCNLKELWRWLKVLPNKQ